MARFNSLLGRNKFPVPLRRELGRKPLYLALDSKPIVALDGPDERNYLYFPTSQGIWLQRRVRSRLPPPAASLVRTDYRGPSHPVRREASDQVLAFRWFRLAAIRY